MDIDVDFKDTFDPSTVFKQAVPASMIKDGELVKHPCGYYFQSIPIDPITSLACIPYQNAQQLGYFKIDLLHLSLLNNFSSKDEIRQYVNSEPDWDLLQYPQHVEKLFQIHNHFETVIKVKPKSVQELADTLALIRPGKRHLIPEYLRNKQLIRQELYKKAEGEDGYSYKKSHAISYALTIVLQLHLISQGKL